MWQHPRGGGFHYITLTTLQNTFPGPDGLPHWRSSDGEHRNGGTTVKREAQMGIILAALACVFATLLETQP